MRMPEEIKKGLEHCAIEGADCTGCVYRDECMEEYDNAPIQRDALAYIQQLEDHIRGLQKMVPKWISVEERLPLHDQDVLVLTAPGTLSLGQNMLVATYIHPRNEQYGVFINFYAGYDDKNILTVTHWMPLSSLPEEDE